MIAPHTLGSAVERRELRRRLFTDEEILLLEEKRPSADLVGSIVAYCSYEGPFARTGGLFPVALHLTRELGKLGQHVVVLTPYHARLKTAPPRESFSLLGRAEVPFGGRRVPLELLEPKDPALGGVRWVHLAAEGFFEAEGGTDGTDPYASAAPERLLTDSLFASAAVPSALAALGHTDVVLHLQDWEFAAAALTLKLALLDGRLARGASVLTLHNPYDHALSPAALALITDRGGRGLPSRTVHECMLPFTDAPIATVSTAFADELTREPAQTAHFAGHLQGVFASTGLIGIDNGVFGDASRAAFSAKAVAQAKQGKPQAILTEKAARRRTLLEALAAYQDPRALGQLDGLAGRPLRTLPDDVPIFFMFGRLDPAQKGFDVFARAVEALPRGFARVVLAPTAVRPGPFLDDLAELAKHRSGEVVVYPFRMARAYAEAMAGASYAVMPSLYEPFGAATEAFLAGTPVIARATGGLSEQVTDVLDGAGTGFLFRESPEGDAEAWRRLLVSRTSRERRVLPLHASMTAALAAALARAACLFRENPSGYGALLGALGKGARRFAWNKVATEYRKLYQRAAAGRA